MATVIRANISKKNKYWIDRHRHYELKHFCLQYPVWEQLVRDLDGFKNSTGGLTGRSNTPGDPTSLCVEMRDGYLERMDLIKRIAYETDPELAEFIFKAVTEELSYTHLRSILNMPCSRNRYYDRYRRFFWLLHQARD